MKKSTSQVRAEQFFMQLLDMPTINIEWYAKRNKAKEYFSQHLGNESINVVVNKLLLISEVERVRINNDSQIAARIVEIKNFKERIEKGDEQLIVDVAKAFAKPSSSTITQCQFQNALHFLALHAPHKYIEINSFVTALLKQVLPPQESLKACLESIPVDKLLDVYILYKALYDAIKEVTNQPTATYESIYEKLTDCMLSASVVLTNPKVLSAGINVTIDACDLALKSQGVGMYFPTVVVQKQIGKLLGICLNPYIQQLHQDQLEKLQTYRNNH